MVIFIGENEEVCVMERGANDEKRINDDTYEIIYDYPREEYPREKTNKTKILVVKCNIKTAVKIGEMLYITMKFENLKDEVKGWKKSSERLRRS